MALAITPSSSGSRVPASPLLQLGAMPPPALSLSSGPSARRPFLPAPPVFPARLRRCLCTLRARPVRPCSTHHRPGQHRRYSGTPRRAAAPSAADLALLSPASFQFATHSHVPAPQSPASVRSRLLTAEREEAKAVLSLFLRHKGLRSTLAARIVNKSDGFIEHLVSKLQIAYRSRYAEGRELSTPEIRDALLPYLEALSKEHGDSLVEVVENFPDPFSIEREAISSSMPFTPTSSNKQKAIARITKATSGGALPELVLYLLDLGMDHEEIKNIVRKFPAFAYYSVDRKIKPLVELLLELGVPKSSIPGIIKKRPQLCGISMSDNLKPMMAYLENIGVNKAQWSKVITRFPALLTYSRNKVETTVSFLTELGVSKKNIGKILTRCPHLMSYSVDDNLRPTAEYFRSIGADAASLVQKSPQAFGLNVEAKLKPITEFFLAREFSIEEIGIMANRFGIIHTLSLKENLLPKYKFFLTMEYPRCELVKFPQYFGYSLDQRIKPRYARMTGCGVRLILNQMLSVSDARFDKILEKKTTGL